MGSARDRQGDRPRPLRADLAEGLSTALAQQGLPANVVWLSDNLFDSVLDGRNASLSDGVQRALGREPRDFADYARDAAAAGAWTPPSTTASVDLARAASTTG